MPKRPPKIEIEKCHLDLLLLVSQTVTIQFPKFLGIVLTLTESGKGAIAKP
jgi:hypothetical protein